MYIITNIKRSYEFEEEGKVIWEGLEEGRRRRNVVIKMLWREGVVLGI